jgi:hypothetical protein
VSTGTRHSSNDSRLYLSLAVAVVLAAAVVPYLSTIDDYFIRDDFGVVQLLASKPARYFPAWFYSSWMDDVWGFLPDEIRPFPAVSYQLTALPGAGNPIGHHVFNIALHAANSVLVLAVAMLVARLRLVVAALAAVVFAVLPVQAESVAWITGRVDSMPAFFYLASFLGYARWRERGGAGRYVVSLALFFIALFTKQTTITMVATLAAFDLLVVRRGEPLWKTALTYVPFLALTAGYLLLRLRLFGQAVREEHLTVEGVGQFLTLADRHLTRVVVGDPDGSRLLTWLLIAIAAGISVAVARARRERLTVGLVLFFGPAWWLIGVAPVAVAGYESPRHVYLASVAWAMLIGLAFEHLHRAPSDRRVPGFLRIGAALVVAAYAFLLAGVVREWNVLALVSERATQQLARESRVAEAGTLIVAGVPGRNWEWALPFAARPPFTNADLTARSFIISPRELYCCRQQWFDDTRKTLRAWAAGPAPGSVLLIRIHERTGAAARLSTAEQPSLPAIGRTLLGVEDADLLDLGIRRLLESLGVGS